jgi:16S rRNA (cytidine1402-2'-O)-methyltransferase
MAVQGFAFMGFIPPKGATRQKALAQVVSSSLPVVIYEAPHRVLQTLRDLVSLSSDDRQLLVARELTKVSSFACLPGGLISS